MTQEAEEKPSLSPSTESTTVSKSSSEKKEKKTRWDGPDLPKPIPSSTPYISFPEFKKEEKRKKYLMFQSIVHKIGKMHHLRAIVKN